MKRWIIAALTAGAVAGILTGCQKSEESLGESLESKMENGERQVIEFWFHAADENSSQMYEELMDTFNQSQEKYEARYTGFSNKDFPDKFAMAVATDTMPDVVSLGFQNVMTYVPQDALVDLERYFEQWEDSSKITPSLIETLKEIGGGKLYGVPYNYNQDICWYNTAFFEENQIDVPKTQKEFLDLCEKYGDADKGTYFYSLRGVKPGDNLLAWLFTYTDGAGYGGSYFDENGKCILNKPEFVEALDAYASIYKNQWVSGDCVNNDFNQMVAEFGSQTAMFIMHNSSSRATHEANLGDGNFSVSKPLANESGRYYTSAIQPQIYSITNKKGQDGDYEGAFELVKFLSSAETVETIGSTLGRIPVNSDNYDDEWFKNNKYMPLYEEIIADENYIQVQNPYWLTSYFNFINTDMTADFQAVLLGEMTSEEALNKWAEFLTSEQEAYLAGDSES